MRSKLKDFPIKLLNKLRTREEGGVYELFFHIFLYILFLVFASNVLLELASYVLNKPDKIITLTFGSIFEPMQNYIMKFDPYNGTYYSMLLALCVFVLYFLIDIYNNIIKDKQNTEGKQNNTSSKIKDIVPILILYLFLCIIYIITKTKNKLIIFGIIFSIFYGFILCKYVIQKMFLNIPENRSKKEIYVSLFILFLFLLILLYSLSFEFPYRGDFTRIAIFANIISFITTSFVNIVFNFDIILFFEKLLLLLIFFTLICYMFKLLVRRNLMKIWESIKKFIRRNPWNTGIFIYSLSLYLIICLFFVNISIRTKIGIGTEVETEIGTPSGVLILLGFAVLISGGLSMCGSVVNRIMSKNEKMLELLGVNIGKKNKKDSKLSGINTKRKSEETFMKKLRKHIDTLLLNFLIAVSSYIFLSALFKTFLQNFQEIDILLSDLNLILFIPLYLFFFRAGSTIAENAYKKLYELIEEKSELIHDETREMSFVKVFVTLTKVTILILIFVHVLSRFVIFEAIKTFISTQPFNYIIELAIAVPVAMQVLVLILDPFFEKETIEVGSNIGKIKEVGYFFTKMETMEGENVYIPNAELLARTIKRLNVRAPHGTKDKKRGKSQVKEEKEKGVMIHFSCTLNYNYEPKDIKKIFKAIFKEKSKKEDGTEKDRKEELKTYLSGIGYEDVKEQLDFIFSTGESHPFVFIEDFKDHGIVYRFNFRVRNALYAPIFRGYFMEEFKLEMNENKKHIYTPLKHEITDVVSEKDKEWKLNYI